MKKFEKGASRCKSNIFSQDSGGGDHVQNRSIGPDPSCMTRLIKRRVQPQKRGAWWKSREQLDTRERPGNRNNTLFLGRKVLQRDYPPLPVSWRQKPRAQLANFWGLLAHQHRRKACQRWVTGNSYKTSNLFHQ
jgi:hypothetical protein